jgi:uncharacterized membrane protein YwzB
MPSPKANATKEVALELINHGFWIAVAFVALIAIAGGVEQADRGLILMHVFKDGGILDHAAKIGAATIALGDIVLTIVAGYILARHFLKQLTERLRAIP